MQKELEREVRLYEQAILLERLFPRSARKVIKAFLYVATIATFIASALFVIESRLSVGYYDLKTVLFYGNGTFFFGLFLLSFSFLFILSMLSFFYNARYYRGIESITHEGYHTKDHGVTYEVAEVLGRGHADLTTALFTSRYGLEMLDRCNIERNKLNTFLNNRKEIFSADFITLPEKGFITLEHLAGYVYKNDKAFADFLFDEGITETVFNGAVTWTIQTNHHVKHDTRWWSKDNLGKVPTFGKEFSYGGAYMLDRFSRDIKTTAVFSVLSSDVAYADEKIEQMESVLSRSKDANVLLVGEQGVGKMDLVMRLYQKMQAGDASPVIVDKKIVVLDADGFIAQHDTKEELERGLVRMFDQATNAGGVIVAIDNLPSFLQSAAAVGVNVPALIDLYLASPELQIIATSDPVQFHSAIESKPTLVGRFERVQVESPDLSSSVRVLQSIATEYERKFNIIFTYPSIDAIAESADRYITDGVMPDKAVELLTEIAPNAARAGLRKITKEYVNKYVSDKTGIPTGPVQEEEKEKLLNLEKILHERVIGQENAIKAISGVMRRARAGVQDADRPLGSFMFLGSTGVGKTETAKALAHVFFGGEEHMSRIDMSEYSGPNELSQLIGDGKEKVGALSMLLKEKPYGVLLLDEFEKASEKVHDLFLQIIDEGFFTDARGAKINARNNIIIATSNAGATMIWDLAKQNKNPNDEKDKIIEFIISEKVYKPELLNRFDGVIVFEPLKLSEQEKIARLMLESLSERIKKKGYELVVDDVLISLLVSKGYDPEFGARPMRRVLQDYIEEKIAEKIIAGGLRQGDKIWFYEEDFK